MAGTLVPAGGFLALWGVHDLRGAGTHLGLPAGDEGSLATVALRDGMLHPIDVPCRLVPVLPAVRRLAALPPGPDWPRWQRPSASVLAWSVAAKLGLELVARGRLVPLLDPDAEPTTVRARWRVAAVDDPRLDQLASCLPVAAHAVRGPSGALTPASAAVRGFLDAIADACAREGRRPERDPRRRGPRRPWAQMWADALTGSDPTVAHLRVPADELTAAVAEWSAPVTGGDHQGAARLALRLEPPLGDEADPASGHDQPWRLRYRLQATRDPAVTVEAADVWQRGHRRLEMGGRYLEDPEATLVTGLAAAARLFTPIDRSLSETRPTEVAITPAEVAELLTEAIDALSAGGIAVEVPPELQDRTTHRVRLRIRLGASSSMPPRVPGAAPLGIESLTDLRYEVVVGDDVLTAEEFAALIAMNAPLVRWRGRWVQVDPTEVDRLADLAGHTASLELTEALAAALSGQHRVDELGWIEAVADGDLGELVQRLRDSEIPEDADVVGIDGELRPYQRRGVAWLQNLTSLGMGGVLADEMGLGKTLQAIALLTSRSQDRPHLVVCPTSVVGNWERELQRFAPGVPVIRHHGADRQMSRRAFRPGHVAVTSYALLRRDRNILADIDWDVVVLDEAQQIKNPSSKGARAARELTARARIAMTGTPIENRLSELWAIVDVTNPGLLGSQRVFNERFGVPIERWHDRAAADRLRRLVAPFVLRRRKGDPAVAVDLPPKQEITVACALTREQATLYQQAVDAAFSGQGLGANTFERRGRILALLTALKQICNHPAHYLRDAADSNGRLAGRSGKLARATEILAELVDADERALVFTQFREMGDLLVRHLTQEIGLPEVPFLHGGLTLPARDAMVRRFQEDPDAAPVLLVSLRAGGTGLNLTRATHVVHFDRWWNPAVEDQATDRAHRIGQTRAVTVHRLVTAGTLEERIDDLLERKRALADTVVSSGEAWLTDLDDDDLRDLVSLSTADLADDDGDDDDDLVPAGRPVLTAIPGGSR